MKMIIITATIIIITIIIITIIDLEKVYMSKCSKTFKCSNVLVI